MRLRDQFKGRLFRKYVAYFAAVVSIALLYSGIGDIYFQWLDLEKVTRELQRERAFSAASIIESHITGIARSVAGLVPDTERGERATREELLLDGVRLLRQLPAVSHVRILDEAGREQVLVSRLAPNVLGSGADFTGDKEFLAARKGEAYFGPVYFYRDTEPHMTMAVNPSPEGWTVMADINLKFMRDVVSRMSFGKTGRAYVVDLRGQLVAHAEMAQVLNKTDMSALPQVAAALRVASGGAATRDAARARDLQGRHVVAARATIPSLGWTVFSEQLASEAYSPIHDSSVRTVLYLFFGLALAIVAGLFLVWKVLAPVQALQHGAERLGLGQLDHRLDVRTADELEALAGTFNRMAADLQASRADLEKKIALRTKELELANQAKSRFLAVASHELNQPMHALGLFISVLRERAASPEIAKIVGEVERSAEALRALLDALLDVSRLDAGGKVTPRFTVFEVQPLIERLRAEFALEAREKGLQLRVRSGAATVRSDPALLERILRNLVSNALRYTHRGGILIGCRRRGGKLSVEVFDTGVGICPADVDHIFEEFYQAEGHERDGRKGLGLGLSIVRRLGQLLDHEIRVRSRPGRGSLFRVEVPLGQGTLAEERDGGGLPAGAATRQFADKLIVVIDDELTSREAMRLLVTQWGCDVVAACSGDEAARALSAQARTPDGILADYWLDGGETGLEAVRRLQASYGRPIPAAIVTGDTRPEISAEAADHGVPVLYKPVPPARLQALLAEITQPGRRG